MEEAEVLWKDELGLVTSIWGQFWASHDKKNLEGLERVHGRERSWGRIWSTRRG